MVATAYDRLLHPACETGLCQCPGLSDLNAGNTLVLTELGLRPQSVSVMTHIRSRGIFNLGNFSIVLSPHVWLLAVPKGAGIRIPCACFILAYLEMCFLDTFVVSYSPSSCKFISNASSCMCS